MAKEEKATINYSGQEVNELLRQGKKIVTLRKPKEKYNIPVGTRFDAICTDADDIVPGMVIANDTRPIRKFSDASLLLDGYALPEIAAASLEEFYGNVTVDSLMQRIATLPDEIWDSLPEVEQVRLLQLGLEAAMKVPEFRKIFMPALLYWFLTYGNANLNEWHGWLTRQGLVTKAEIEAKMTLDKETEYFYTDTLFAMGGLKWLLEQDPNSPEFRNVVLHEAVAIPL